MTVAANQVSSMTNDPVRQDLLWRQAAGLPKPATSVDLVAALAKEPTPSAVAGVMVADIESLNPKWLERHIGRYQRALTVEKMRTTIEQVARNRAAEHRARGAVERFNLLSGPISEALARFVTVVKALPDGDDALRPEVNIDAGTTEQLAEVRELLRRIGVMVGSLPLDGHGRAMGRWTLAVVDVPTVEPAKVQRGGTEELNPSSARDAIKEACAPSDADLVLVDVARNRWPDLSLRLVGSRQEHSDRGERIQTAHLTITKEHR